MRKDEVKEHEDGISIQILLTRLRDLSILIFDPINLEARSYLIKCGELDHSKFVFNGSY